MNVKVLLAPNLPLAVELTPDITVEAEYGSTVVWGRHYTAAHHQPSGPFMGRHLAGGTAPSPCNDTRIPLLETGVILVSHLDLDTVGGVLRALHHARMLFQPTFQSFWDLAEAVDKTSSIASFGGRAVDFPGTLENSVLYLRDTFLRFSSAPTTGATSATFSASSASRSTAAALTRMDCILRCTIIAHCVCLF